MTTTCTYCGTTLATPQGRAAHERHCTQNPNPPNIRPRNAALHEVLDTLDQLGGKATLTEIQETTGTSRTMVGNACVRLTQNGNIRRIAPATYQLINLQLPDETPTNGKTSRRPKKTRTRTPLTRPQIRSTILTTFENDPTKTFTLTELRDALPQPLAYPTLAKHVRALEHEGNVHVVGRIGIGGKNVYALAPSAWVEQQTSTDTPPPNISQARANHRTNQKIVQALNTLYPNTNINFEELLDWIDTTRELLRNA